MALTLNPSEYYAFLRRDFSSFIERAFCHLNPTTPYLDNWHLDLLAAKLEACRRGTMTRLIICVPPRSLKSHCASVALPAWWLGHAPTAQLLCVSYAQELADKHARDCRSVMTSPWFHSLFPRTHLSRQKQAIEEFMTTCQGVRLATSVGGVLTGRGADVLIIDDPLKPDEALSDLQRRKVNEWYSHTLYSRLNSKADGCIILIMQRLHEDDLVGHVLKQEPWELVSLPAIAESDEEHRYETPYGHVQHRRHTGEALHPERESLQTLAHVKQTLGSYHFAGQYQQTPAPLEGGLVKRDWFRYYRVADLPLRSAQVVQSWDTANKASELANYSVCTTWGLVNRQRYLLEVWRQQVNYPELKRAVMALARQWRATVILIEDRASGTQLLQELQAEGLSAVTAIQPVGDKVMRLHAQTAVIEQGRVWLPHDAPWLEPFLHELTTFPKSAYDDQVDSVAQALAWMTQAEWTPVPGVFVF
jgi:predicted phage terminase large subunit-like protein